MSEQLVCECGHGINLHNAHGCAGYTPPSIGTSPYCACIRRPADVAATRLAAAEARAEVAEWAGRATSVALVQEQRRTDEAEARAEAAERKVAAVEALADENVLISISNLAGGGWNGYRRIATRLRAALDTAAEEQA